MNLRYQGIKDIFIILGKEEFIFWLSGIQGDGEYKHWYANGQLNQHGFYKNGKKDGEYKSWFKNGDPREHFIWKDGKLIERKKLI